MRRANLKSFLDSVPSDARKLVLNLRSVVRQICPYAEESVLWGGLSYHRPEVGGRVKGAVCQIVVKQGKVRLDFIHGVRLTDPCGLLQGERVSKRFIQIDTVVDAKRRAVAALIREANALDPTKWA